MRPSNALMKSSSKLPIIGRVWDSTIGKKLLVALTGLILVLFLVGHLTGNLLIFLGEKSFNDYAALLHGLAHGAGIWIARLGLLAAVVIHIAATISLTRRNKAARRAYENESTIQAKKSSLVMIWTGLTILAFIIYHLIHFTFRPTFPAEDYVYRSELKEVQFNAYRMVIDGFQNWVVVLFYVIAISMLCSHLSHGVQAMFQTLGLRSKKSAGMLDKFSYGFAAVIWLGFISIPVSILIFNYGS